MFYIHPWELDDWVPEVDAPRRQMVRTFFGRRRTWGRMDALCAPWAWGRVRDTCDRLEGADPTD